MKSLQFIIFMAASVVLVLIFGMVITHDRELSSVGALIAALAYAAIFYHIEQKDFEP